MGVFDSIIDRIGKLPVTPDGLKIIFLLADGCALGKAVFGGSYMGYGLMVYPDTDEGLKGINEIGFCFSSPLSSFFATLSALVKRAKGLKNS